MTFPEAAASPDPVPTLIEVWVPSCSVCRAMDPDLDAAADRYAGSVAFERLDATNDVQRARSLGAYATPTMIGLLHGEEVYRSTGRLGEEDIDAVFRALASGVHPDQPSSTTQVLLGVGAGATLVGAGVFLGPSTGLIATGAAVALVTIAVAWRKRRSRSV